MATQRYCEGFTKSCCLRKSIAASCFLRIVFESRKMSDTRMIIQSYNEDVTIWKDAITLALRGGKWTYMYEVNRKMNLCEDFGHSFIACQRFSLRSRSCYRSLENTTCGHTMGKDGFANGPMFSRSDPNLNIFIFFQIRDSVTLALIIIYWTEFFQFK